MLICLSPFLKSALGIKRCPQRSPGTRNGLQHSKGWGVTVLNWIKELRSQLALGNSIVAGGTLNGTRDSSCNAIVKYGWNDVFSVQV